MCVACGYKHFKYIAGQVLLLNGADVNSVDSGNRSALLSACWQGHLVIADILLTAGAEVNHQCGQGASPLAVAAQEGHMEVLQLLLQHGADPMLQVFVYTLYLTIF